MPGGAGVAEPSISAVRSARDWRRLVVGVTFLLPPQRRTILVSLTKQNDPDIPIFIGIVYSRLEARD